MGLLKGFGRDLKGLLKSGELGDTFAEAQAWLDGDYGDAMKLGERDLARRRARREARRRAEEAERDISRKADPVPPTLSQVPRSSTKPRRL